jgi:hypothetical protein
MLAFCGSFLFDTSLLPLVTSGPRIALARARMFSYYEGSILIGLDSYSVPECQIREVGTVMKLHSNQSEHHFVLLWKSVKCLERKQIGRTAVQQSITRCHLTFAL